MGTDTIPADLIHSASSGGSSLQFTLSHEGEFSFTAVLSMNFGKENAGRTARLYYYNRGTGVLELMSKENVAEDGTIRLTFTHASEYVIVMDGQAGSGNGNAVSGTLVTAPKSGDQENGSLWWILMAGALAVIIGTFLRHSSRTLD